MFQCEIKAENCQQKGRKPFAHLPITCPWSYKVPLNSMQNKIRSKKYYQNPKIEQASNIYKSNAGDNFERQYYNFLRLMHSFPSIHPANIHRILLSCNYDVCRAADKLRRVFWALKGPHRPNIQRYPRFYDKFSYNCRNLSGHVLNSVVVAPDCCAGPKTYIKYDIPRNLYR